MKKGGTKWNKNQPFLKNEFTFNKKWKMEKLLNCLYNPDHVQKWDQIIQEAKDIRIDENMKSCQFNYIKNHK